MGRKQRKAESLFPLFPGEQGLFCDQVDLFPIGGRLRQKDQENLQQLEGLCEHLPRWTPERIGQFLRPARTFGFVASGSGAMCPRGEFVGYGLACKGIGNHLEVRRLFVHPCVRRRGVGKRLLEALLRAAKPVDLAWVDVDEVDVDTQKVLAAAGWAVSRVPVASVPQVTSGHYRFLYRPK
jgi:GNAT superfamily N-acetyltransferase